MHPRVLAKESAAYFADEFIAHFAAEFVAHFAAEFIAHFGAESAAHFEAEFTAHFAAEFIAQLATERGAHIARNFHIVRHYYDVPASHTSTATLSNWAAIATVHPTFIQHNSRRRLSWMEAIPHAPANATSVANVVRTFFDYDAKGNVVASITDVPKNNTATSPRLAALTRLGYDHSLGHVNRIDYEPDVEQKRFVHQYHFDDAGRLESVETSRNNVIRQRDAGYSYDPKGMLSRVTIGEDFLQGLDYTYTLLGSLKGINHPLRGVYPSKDPGLDGEPGEHEFIPFDALGMLFSYHTGDFERAYVTGQVTEQSQFNYNDAKAMPPAVQLYSGQLGAWSISLDPIDDGAGNPVLRNGALLGEQMRYDRIGRLRSSQTWNWNVTNFQNDGANGYASSYVYDQNSNPVAIRRDGLTAGGADIVDDAELRKASINSNITTMTVDAEGVAGYNKDIVSDQPTTDVNGRQVQRIDAVGTVVNTWTSFDRLRSVAGTDEYSYLYDGFRNLVRVVSGESAGVTTQILIPTGTDVGAHYTFVGESESTNWPIYGATILGTSFLQDPLIENGTDGVIYRRQVDRTRYHLTDHVGSVRLLISDIKIPDQYGFDADIVALADYDPYGQLRPNRCFSIDDGTYAYGFQGMRRQIQGDRPNLYTTAFRDYNASTQDWLSHDAIFHTSQTPYGAFGANPVMYTDPFGLNQDLATPLKAGGTRPPTYSYVKANVDALNVPKGLELAKSPPTPIMPGSSDYYIDRHSDFQKRYKDLSPPDYYLEYGNKYLRRFTESYFEKLWMSRLGHEA